MPQVLSIVTLLTDFGDRDWFVASMKGVILSINPNATVVDLSHDIQSHDIEDGAFFLHSCYKTFPSGTVHVAVVDPGVGGTRRPLLVSTDHHFFIAPDNGLLTRVLEEGPAEVRVIENRQYALEPLGRTFDGRDIFAPAAAWLTMQQPVASFGPLVGDPKRIPVHAPRWEGQALEGEIEYIDKFGNLITNLRQEHVHAVLTKTGRSRPSIHLCGTAIVGLATSYGEGIQGKPCALINSNGHLEVFIKEASAAVQLSGNRHDVVRLT